MIEHWRSAQGDVAAMLHKDGLSVFDGRSLRTVDVQKRNYTSMVADRNDNLWLGSLEGLSFLTPAGKLQTVFGREYRFNSEKIVTMAAAPDNAKYPYVLAVAVDEKAVADPGSFNFFKSSDPPPMLIPACNDPYRLQVVNADVSSSQIMLFDGEKWEPMFRPGVNKMMFDQTCLWLATSCRVMRLYLPTVVEGY
jgi:ligand-binding sensor domain-containing protein